MNNGARSYPDSRSVIAAAVALLVSALSLWTILTVAYSPGGSPVPDIELKASELNVEYGNYYREGAVLALFAHDASGYAVAAKNVEFPTSDYPYLKFQLTSKSMFKNFRVYLVWTSTHPSEPPSNLELHPLDRGVTTAILKNADNWRGRVRNVGIYVSGATADDPLMIESLKLLPEGLTGNIHASRSLWQENVTWQHFSINHLMASTPLSHVAVAGAWILLAFLILEIGRYTGLNAGVWSYFLAAFIVWVSVDLVWVRQLNANLQIDRAAYAGKSMHDRLLAGIDSGLYRYAHKLKKKLLPTKPSRIFILSDSSGHDYERLKLQYYLLPHNVYNYGRVPPDSGVLEGDYLIILGEIPDLEENHRGLTWGQAQSLNVSLLDAQDNARLYRVVNSAELRGNSSEKQFGGTGDVP